MDPMLGRCDLETLKRRKSHKWRVPADCTDGFNAAYWRRPRAYLDPRVWQPMSALALLPEADRIEGMRRLEADLDSGEWDRRWGTLLALDEFDLGYRVVTATA